MAPGRPVKVIKLKVPRHNAQRVGAKLGAEIKNLAKVQKIKADIYQPSPEVAQAIVRIRHRVIVSTIILIFIN